MQHLFHHLRNQTHFSPQLRKSSGKGKKFRHNSNRRIKKYKCKISMFLSVLFLPSMAQWEIELINKFKHKILKNYKINAQISIHFLADVWFLVCMKICLEHIFKIFFLHYHVILFNVLLVNIQTETSPFPLKDRRIQESYAIEFVFP